MIRFLAIFFAILFLLPVNAYAIPDDGNRGSCSWEELLEKIGEQESGHCKCDDQYRKTSKRTDDPSWGKWQFTPGTWKDFVAVEYPQCYHEDQETSKLRAISKDCWPVQKWAATKMMEEAKAFFESNGYCADKLGTTVSGCHQGSCLECQINKSGLMSAYHNARRNACVFAGGTSEWSEQINWRICDAQNIPFPENCTPENPEPTVPDEVTPGTPIPFTPPFEHPSHFNALTASLQHIWVAAFQLMTTQLSTTMMEQVQVIGTFFDAKHQLETQRLMQQKAAQAHKDYHPSLQMCEIGTFSRDLANTSIRAELSKTAASRAMLDRALASGEVKTVKGSSSDRLTRRDAYIEKFCNIKDNQKQNKLLCKKSGKPEQQNADINFTQTIDAPLTLDINLLDEEEESLEKENLFAFLDYIFMNESFPFVSQSKTEYHPFIGPYQDMRSLVAMRSVAQNSFANIIAQKTAGPDKEGETAAPFLKALMREIGLEDGEIEETIGKNPSYYAQMEILTKKIYQHPEFISNLYDKPANVKRIRAAMTAIKLMQDRDIHDSMLRREMLVSMILELRLRQKQSTLSNNLEFIIANPPGVVTSKGVYGHGEKNKYGVGTYDEKRKTGGF